MTDPNVQVLIYAKAYDRGARDRGRVALAVVVYTRLAAGGVAFHSAWSLGNENMTSRTKRLWATGRAATPDRVAVPAIGGGSASELWQRRTPMQQDPDSQRVTAWMPAGAAATVRIPAATLRQGLNAATLEAVNPFASELQVDLLAVAALFVGGLK